MHASVNSERNKELVFKIIKLKDFLKIKNQDQRRVFVIQVWCGVMMIGMESSVEIQSMDILVLTLDHYKIQQQQVV